MKKGRITLNQFVDLTSTRAAKFFGLFPKKGTIAVGADADLVIFDPNVERVISAETHHMAVDYNAFEGMKVTGEPFRFYLVGNLLFGISSLLENRVQDDISNGKRY